MTQPTTTEPKPVNLALQGGGALGAFTWGVLDRLLEDGRLSLCSISGASAGAMNAVVLAAGYEEGGPEGARAALRRFWEGVAEAGENNPFRRTPIQALMMSALGPWRGPLETGWRIWWNAVAGATTPYTFSALNTNPLEDLLAEQIDFERVRRCADIRLYVAATNVETGRARVFTNEELTARHVAASACLPQLFRAVEIDGHFYWDGGYMGNPPLYPLFQSSRSRDVLIVQVNPVERKGEPQTAEAINGRINEITFNASLLRELRAIEFVARLLDEGRLDQGRYRKMLIHVINDDAKLTPLGAQAKLNTDRAFFNELFAFGRATAEGWLEKNVAHVGKRSTVDLRAMFEGDIGPDGSAQSVEALLRRTDVNGRS